MAVTIVLSVDINCYVYSHLRNLQMIVSHYVESF